jgi:SAM-dependent methyltransferase
VLEIGCGTGNNLWFLADAGFTIAGLDIAPTAIAIARERLACLGHTDVDLRIGDLFSLPWPDEAFDIVIEVFDAATIRALWRDFLIETLTRHEITPAGENFLEERFSVWARRVAARPRA